ncbi:hypothetical protein LCGC14_1433610 [marine sediment metagenome]|uniref:Uncharacterized protein n=1 Tax=marine sediment metagenome TaxID=412755 RepID=A0A0F9MPP7_9ZZZZ
MPATCTLCDEPGADIEVAALGLERRVHRDCFQAVLPSIREMGTDTFVAMVEEQERVSSVQRD